MHAQGPGIDTLCLHFLFSATECSFNRFGSITFSCFAVCPVPPSRQCVRRRDRAQLAMAAGPKSQYAHLANLAVDFVRKRPNRACPRIFSLSRRDRPAPLPDVRLTSLSSSPRVAVFELAKMRPAYGVGSRFARARWEERGAPDSFWTVTRMKPRPSGRSGSAWGFLTWKGKARPGVTRIPKAQTPGIWKVLEEETDVRGPALAMPPEKETESEAEEK